MQTDGMPYLEEIMRKKTKRKVWSLIDPLTHAIVGASITQRHKLDQLRLLEYSALDAMTKGQGTIQDWRTLVDVLNLSEMMGKGGVGAEVLPVCQIAQDSLHKAALHYQKTLHMVLDYQGMQALRELIEYADLQQSSISRSEFEHWIMKTKNYIKSNNKQVIEIV